ncbi:MAG: shikimate kinase [Bdellovibrionales bacterium]
MRLAIVGHRGAGKSSLLKRLKGYYSDYVCVDLDEYIERAESRTIIDIFKKEGESFFRSLETKYFNQLLLEQKDNLIVSLGAGFEARIPKDLDCVWLKRKTDPFGRSFFDRPNLSGNLSPLDDYLARFESREKKYREQCNSIYQAPEGKLDDFWPEKYFFDQKIVLSKSILTIRPFHLCSLEKEFNFLNWELKYYELRDDLLSEKEMEKCVSILPKTKILLSFRDPERSPHSMSLMSQCSRTDWAYELGESPFELDILSLHPNNLDMEEIEKIESRFVFGHLKLSPILESISELEKLYLWQKQQATKRSILPRSSGDLDFSWFRLLQSNIQQLNFVEDGTSDVSSQANIMEILAFDGNFKSFGAVLGDPVLHSQSPMEHFKEFSKHRENFLAIQMPEDQFTMESLRFLKMLGMDKAAITSPLKIKAAHYSDNVNKEEAVNTLKNTETFFESINTDQAGLRVLLKGIEGETVIWGGGGTLAAIQNLIPDAIPYSARKSEPRDKRIAIAPKNLIWAAGSREVNIPEKWELKKIIDLSYTWNSPAREYAVIQKIEYVSGIEMFEVQASEQRKYWYGRE